MPSPKDFAQNSRWALPAVRATCSERARLGCPQKSGRAQTGISRSNVSCLTGSLCRVPYGVVMTTKISQQMSDLKDDLRIDYALIALGVGVAVTALIYLLLI